MKKLKVLQEVRIKDLCENYIRDEHWRMGSNYAMLELAVVHRIQTEPCASPSALYNEFNPQLISIGLDICSMVNNFWELNLREENQHLSVAELLT